MYYILRGDRLPHIFKLFNFRKSCYKDPKANLNYKKFTYCGEKCVLQWKTLLSTYSTPSGLSDSS